LTTITVTVILTEARAIAAFSCACEGAMVTNIAAMANTQQGIGSIREFTETSLSFEVWLFATTLGVIMQGIG
jgi:hypothetical protein